MVTTSTKVYLIERTRTLPSGELAVFYVLRWSDSRGQMQQESIGKAARISGDGAKRFLAKQHPDIAARLEDGSMTVAVAMKRAGVHLSTGDVTAARAKDLRREKEHALAGGRAPRDRLGRMRLSEFIKAVERTDGATRRHGTIVEWRTVGKHAIDALGDKLLTELRWEDAGRIRDHLKDRSPATTRKVLVTLKGLLNRAVKRGLLFRNPFENEAMGPQHKREKRIFATAEVAAMVKVAPSDWWQAFITLAITSGLRRSELLHLRWTDVDVKAGTIRVEAHHAGRHRVGKLDVPILPWEPKTARSIRTVPVPPQAVAMLLRLQVKAGGSPYVFVGVDRLRALDARGGRLSAPGQIVPTLNRDFAAIQTAAAAEMRADNWRPGCVHDLRKTFATRAAAAGVPMHELQAHLGHSTITMTADYYTDVEASAADRLRAVFAGVA